MSKATDRLRRLLYERTLLVLIIMFCTGVVIIMWHVYRLQSNLIESVMLSDASLYAPAGSGERLIRAINGGHFGEAD